MREASDLKPGCRVVRRDIPGIFGVLVGLRNGWGNVRWSVHFSQWIHASRLTKHHKESEAQ
jgi:hypothetical protein